MKNKHIKALPAFYKSIQFKSRLEARWAYYFDNLRLDWVYEPEGFELPSRRYLPDFLIEGKTWAEVKPELWLADNYSYTLCNHLIELVQHTRKSLILLEGLPRPDGRYFAWDYVDESEFESIDKGRHPLYMERLYGLDCPNVAEGKHVDLTFSSAVTERHEDPFFQYQGWGEPCDMDPEDWRVADDAGRLQFDRQGRAFNSTAFGDRIALAL